MQREQFHIASLTALLLMSQYLPVPRKLLIDNKFIHLSHFLVSDNREIHSSLPLFLLMNYSEYRLAAIETRGKSCTGKFQLEIKLLLHLEKQGKLNLNTGINSWQRKGALLLAQNSATLHSRVLQFIENFLCSMSTFHWKKIAFHLVSKSI